MKKMMSIGLVVVIALVLGIPDLFAQQQAQPQSQQQQTMQCPMMGQGGMHRGMQHGTAAQGMNCPRMNVQCPMAKQAGMMQSQQPTSPESGTDKPAVVKQ